MNFVTILFQNNKELCYCNVNDITLKYYKITSGLDEKTCIRNYITFWLKALDLFDTYKNFKLIGKIKKNDIIDELEYSLIINEQKKELNIDKDFTLAYNNLLKTNDLWDGRDYQEDDIEYEPKKKVKNSDLEKHIIEVYGEKYTNPEFLKMKKEDARKKIRFFGELFNETKILFYRNRYFTQLYKYYKYSDKNYNKVRYNFSVKSSQYSMERMEDYDNEFSLEIQYELNNDSNSNIIFSFSQVYHDEGDDFCGDSESIEQSFDTSPSFPPVKGAFKEFLETIDTYSIFYDHGKKLDCYV